MKGREGRRGGGQRGDRGKKRREKETGTERSGNTNEFYLYYTRLDIAQENFYGTKMSVPFLSQGFF